MLRVTEVDVDFRNFLNSGCITCIWIKSWGLAKFHLDNFSVLIESRASLVWLSFYKSWPEPALGTQRAPWRERAVGPGDREWAWCANREQTASASLQWNSLIFQNSNGGLQEQRTEIQYIQKHYSVSSGQFLSISYNALGRSYKYRSLKEKKKVLVVYSDWWYM